MTSIHDIPTLGQVLCWAWPLYSFSFDFPTSQCEGNSCHPLFSDVEAENQRDQRTGLEPHPSMVELDWEPSRPSPELIFLLTLVGSRSHTTAFTISVHVTLMCVDLTQKPPSSSGLPYLLPFPCLSEPPQNLTCPPPSLGPLTISCLPLTHLRSLLNPKPFWGWQFLTSLSLCSLCFPPAMRKFSLTV